MIIIMHMIKFIFKKFCGCVLSCAGNHVRPLEQGDLSVLIFSA